MRQNPDYFERYNFLERKIPSILGAYVLVNILTVALTLAWMLIFEIDIVIRAPSVIRPYANISTLKNASTGTVVSKHFSSGQKVNPGQRLWEIDTKVATSDLETSGERLLRLRFDLTQLEFYAKAVDTETNTIPAGYPEASNSARAYLANLNRLSVLVARNKDRYEQDSALPSSMISARTLKESKDNWLLAQIDLERLRSEERVKLSADRNALLTEIGMLDQHISELGKTIREASVVAPISGTVEEVKRFNEGDFLVSGEEIVKIIPNEDVSPKLEIHIDTKDITELKIGQGVTSLFVGLPPSKYGQITARIVSISADSLVVNGQLSFFLVEAALDRAWVQNKSGKKIFLKPGMTAESRIIVSRKTVMTYLLEKLEYIN